MEGHESCPYHDYCIKMFIQNQAGKRSSSFLVDIATGLHLVNNTIDTFDTITTSLQPLYYNSSTTCRFIRESVSCRRIPRTKKAARSRTALTVLESSEMASNIFRCRVNPGLAVRPGQESVGLGVAGDVALLRIEGQCLPEFEGHIGQDTTRSKCNPARCSRPAGPGSDALQQILPVPAHRLGDIFSRSFSVLSSGYFSYS